MRQIVLDTETTGLSTADGHRIIEIGCVELMNRRLTGNNFHCYVQPDREIDAGAVAVHGITNEFLQDKPRFREIAKDFLTYIQGAELVIHNSAFDVGFMDYEFKMATPDVGVTADYCKILDTLKLARKKHPGQRNTLDALCKRYDIDNGHRELHGALLDAEILADVYLAMTGGQTALILGGGDGEEEDGVTGAAIRRLPADRPVLAVTRATEEELVLHEERLDAIDKISDGQCIWKNAPTGSQVSSSEQ